MKLKRVISLLLFAVYLFAAVGQVWASMNCECVAMKPAVKAHACCSHCTHDQPSSKESFRAPCCSNHHSTEVELYTGSSSDNQKQLKRIVCDLPPALTVDCPCPAHIPLLREVGIEQQAPFVGECCPLPVGFRAPPVLA